MDEHEALRLALAASERTAREETAIEAAIAASLMTVGGKLAATQAEVTHPQSSSDRGHTLSHERQAPSADHRVVEDDDDLAAAVAASLQETAKTSRREEERLLLEIRVRAKELHQRGLRSNNQGDSRSAFALFLEAHELLPSVQSHLLSAANMAFKMCGSSIHTAVDCATCADGRRARELYERALRLEGLSEELVHTARERLATVAQRLLDHDLSAAIGESMAEARQRLTSAQHAAVDEDHDLSAAIDASILGSPPTVPPPLPPALPPTLVTPSSSQSAEHMVELERHGGCEDVGTGRMGRDASLTRDTGHLSSHISDTRDT